MGPTRRFQEGRTTAPGDLSVSQRGGVAKAIHDGTFVWYAGSSNTNDSLASTGPNQFIIGAPGGVGIGTNTPLGELHVAHGSLAMTSSAVHEDEIIVEASDAVLGLYSSTGLSWGSALVLGQMNSGALVDKWALVRGTTSAGNNLHLKFGTNANSPLNVSKVIFYSNGDVSIAGQLSKGSGAFKIDHPLDPTNKFLFHSFVESPDVKNIYDGIVILDDSGEAAVELPSYFDALNREFRYQLTCIGGFANVYIAEEVQNNRFAIAGGAPGMKVSWMVTGVREDAFAEQNRIQVEVDKDPSERGTYLHPEAFGASN